MWSARLRRARPGSSVEPETGKLNRGHSYCILYIHALSMAPGIILFVSIIILALCLVLSSVLLLVPIIRLLLDCN